MRSFDFTSLCFVSLKMTFKEIASICSLTLVINKIQILLIFYLIAISSINLTFHIKKTIFLSPFLIYNFKFYTTKTTYRINKWFFKPIEFDRFNIIFYLLKMLSNFSNNFSFIDLSSSDVGLVESSYIFSIGYHQTGPLPLLPYSPISPVILGNKCQ